MNGRIVLLGLLLAPQVHAQTIGETDRAADEAVLREQHLPTKGPDLLQILRDRTPSTLTIQQFKKHVARLNVGAYADRMKASAELVKMGPVIRPLVENLLQAKGDAETQGRLRQVLDHFPAEKDLAAVAAAARLLRRDQPADSLPVLLAFAPSAPDEEVRQELQQTINALAARDKKSTPLLLEAMTDAAPAKRAAAAEALLRRDGSGVRKTIEPLLKDPDSLVRYQLGLALVEKHDQAGVPLLIQTLGESSSDRAEFALDLLYRVAGEDAPAEQYRGSQDAAAFMAAWRKWYAKHEARLDLAKQLARSELGYTLISCMTLKAGLKGKVYEVTAASSPNVRWEFETSRYPFDMQIIGRNRLLIAEYLGRCVTERDFKGNILWQVSVSLPIACQRLPNGHTFIASRTQLLIVDRDGKAVFTQFQQAASITAARRLRNGQMVIVTSGGRCSLLDAQGGELKSFQLGGNIYTQGGNIEVLANGHVLAPLYTHNLIAEYDWSGTRVWQASLNRPVSVTRLPNGHTLVACSFDSRVVELDANGREVWSCHTDGRPFRAVRR